MAKLFAPRPGRPWIIGHRGAMGHAPENTLASFEKALELGADILELDIHLSRDGVPVVIHDATVDRTTDGSGMVAELTLAELKRLDAGIRRGEQWRGQRIPTLEEVLAWARGRADLLIEIKHGPGGTPYPRLEEKLVELLARYHMTGAVIVQAFDHQDVKRVKELDHSIATAILSSRPFEDPVAAARAVMADLVRPRNEHFNAALVQACHAAGLAAGPWGVQEPERLRACIAAGADSIGTDYPDRLAALLQEA
jgi:glycerophosphoryl diester phosphodiesterase